MSAIPPPSLVPCEVLLPGGVLVLAPLRRFGLAAPETARAGSALGLLRGHPEALARLRRDWFSLDLGGDPYRLSPQQMMSALEAAVAAGRLGAAFFPHVIRPVAVLSADRPPPPTPPAPAPPSVRAMSREQRIEAMLKRVPEFLDGGLKDAFLRLISPTAIGIMVASLVALLVGQFLGYGEIVDAALAAVAFGLAGFAGVIALYDLVAAVWDASKAQNDAELDAAANRFAHALVILGISILMAIIARGAWKRARAGSGKAPGADETGGDAKSDASPESKTTGQTGSNPTAESKTQSTLDRIARGERDAHRNDGSVFRNKEGLLPSQPEGYYKEFVYRSPGTTGPGPERVIVGAGGDVYYTPDHYGSFQKMR